MFGNVTTTKEVANEFNKPLPGWVAIQSATNHRYSELLEIEIDKGKASAIALALETDDALLILDDQKARRIAEKRFFGGKSRDFMFVEAGLDACLWVILGNFITFASNHVL